jgi:hypothetical protein
VGFQLGNAGKVFPTGGGGIALDRTVQTPGVVITAAATGDNPMLFSATCELMPAPLHNPKPGHAGEAEPIDRILRIQKTYRAASNYGAGQHTEHVGLGTATMDVTYTITVGKGGGRLPIKTGDFQPVTRKPIKPPGE